MIGLSFQFFAIAAIGVTLALVAYAAFVRIRAHTYTEKRFCFVALWSCSAVVALAIFSINDVQLISVALKAVGLQVPVATLTEKAFIVFLAISYCYFAKSWALSWNGLLTEEGQRHKQRRGGQSIIETGIKETIRLFKHRPEPKIFTPTSFEMRHALLTKPLDALPMHEQVRHLAVAKWPEYDLPSDGWVGEVSCWKGTDRAFGRPVIVACGLDSQVFNFDGLIELTKSPTKSSTRILFVFTRIADLPNVIQHFSQAMFDIKILSFDELVATVTNFEEYRRAIEMEFKHKRLPDADFSISDILAPTLVQLENNRENSRNEVPPSDFEVIVSDWLAEKSGRQLALLGEYGQGKSTAVLALTYRLLFTDALQPASGRRIPILIRLTGRSPSTTRLGELLGAWGSQYNLSGQVLLSLHRAGRLLLIFDAFDEMANVMDRAARFSHFDALWEFAGNGSKILFTGRPNFFLDDEELKELLGITRSAAIGPYCEALRVAPFGLDQIDLAISWLPVSKKNVLLDNAKHSPEFREVCCRPSLLYLIAHLWNRDRLDLSRENVKSASIIREFILYSLERQVQKQKDDISSPRSDRQFIGITKNELAFFTSGVAVLALTNGRQNSIPMDDFEGQIARLYEQLPSDNLPKGTDEVGILALPLQDRFSDTGNPIEACANAVRTHGVIEHDVAKSRYYRFSHKSFAEVLAAEQLTNRILFDDEVSAAIERAGDTPLIELTNQAQVVEFLAEFLAVNPMRAMAIDYESIFNRMFPVPSMLEWTARIRSIVLSWFYIMSVRPIHFILGMILLATVLSVMLVTLERLAYPTYTGTFFASYMIASSTCLITFGVLVRAARISYLKLSLIDRLCGLLNRKGHPATRTWIEARAHSLASDIVRTESIRST